MCTYMIINSTNVGCYCKQGPALTEMFGWLMAKRLLKGEWNSATMESGEPCAITAGVETMHWWCADS